MIYAHAHLAREDHALDADLVVIGSGAGGAPVAAEAAKAGLRVIVLEAGSLITPRQMTQLEHEMLPRLYHEGAGRATADKAVQVHQGKGVGGSTLHNLNLCKRTPDAIIERWRAEHGLAALPPARWAALYDEVERLLHVETLDERHLNGLNRVFKRGVEALGWRGGFLAHNRKGCLASGFCELGCPFDAKENALKRFLAPAIESSGLTVLCDTWATEIAWTGRRAIGVRARVRDPRTGAVQSKVEVSARAVCVAASATGTPALLRRSGVPDPHQLVGSQLFLHPGAAVAGVFEETLSSWIGVPQSYECTELLDLSGAAAPGGPGAAERDKRCWIVGAFAHPSGVSAMLQGFGAEHARYLTRYPQLAALSPMVHDQSPGRVTPTRKDPFGVRIDYWLSEADRAQLKAGLIASAQILQAAGAERVVIPFARTVELGAQDDPARALADVEIRRQDLAITSVHPMASVWLGDDPRRACVDSTGRYHHLDNLYVSDTSLFPSSIGVPPQLTAYALGLHVGRTIAAAAK